ncbi:MAG: ABC transporter permease [Bacteroidia bacterium]|nr:ABC transporter permease [Bacteroidia bacterium]
MAAIRYLLAKELKQFVRDPFMPRLALFFPVVLMLVMPWIATMDIKNVNISVVDEDGSPMSGRLVRKIEASDYFILKDTPSSYGEAFSGIEDGSTDIVLNIPRGMERGFVGGENVEVYIAANAVNSTKGSLGAGYLNSIVSEFSAEESGSRDAPVRLSVHYAFNPHLNYRLFMVPAFLIMVLIAICGFLPTVNIVSEKERGTIEQINVTPVGKGEFIASKIIFYGLLGLIIFTLSFLIGKFVYGIAPYGGYAAIYLAAVLFLLFMTGFGLTISNFSATLQQAVFAMFFFMMIFVLMSGLFTPAESMAGWAYGFSTLLPSRYFVDIMRAVCLKGSRIADVGFDFAMLALFSALMNVAAILTYRKRG